MKSFKAGACAIALVIALGAAGCGGSDDDSSSGDVTTSDLTKEEFITQADAICAASNKAISNAAGKELSANPTPEETESFISDTVVPQVQTQIDGVRELGAPEGDEDDVSAILDAVQSANDDVKADPASATDEDADPFGEANDLAKEYGLVDCAS